LAYRDWHPFATIAGSSNYGYRSQQRDMETGCVLVTHNLPLRRRMHDERVHMMQHNQQLLTSSSANGTEHCAPLWVRFVYRFARHFF
jgi:phosphatidylserine/phosphatidylglycerophosphate/cardiolipin synthase-like enzyme